MSPVTIGTRVRDQKTRLTGTVVTVFPDVRPGVDLLAIRLDNRTTAYGPLTCAFDCEVDVLDQDAEREAANGR